MVGSEARNEIRFESNLNGKFIRSEIASFAQATPSTIQIADINPHLTYTTSSIPILQRAQSIGDPRSIVWDAAGARAYVCGIGSNIDVATDVTGARLATFSVGEGASGLALAALHPQSLLGIDFNKQRVIACRTCAHFFL